jgi:hypothetical protein
MSDQILNLTQHVATPDQLEVGVIEPSPEVKQEIQRLLTFNDPPCRASLDARAENLAHVAKVSGLKQAMIGGAPFLMGYLERELIRVKVQALYSFSKREVTETVTTDGKVEKKAVFKHAGWVPGQKA